MAVRRVVILGAGQAGCQAVQSLRQLGFGGAITMVGEEPAPPYQRPPLSKAYLKGEMDAERLWLKPPEFYVEQKVDLLLGERAEALDLATRWVGLSSGHELEWDALVVATGARPRKLAIRGAGLRNVLELRTLADVDRLKPLVVSGRRLVVVGAGYIGLEAAAVAAQLGMEVTVLEAAPQVLGRVTGPEIASFYAETHRAHGVDIRVNAKLEAFEGDCEVSGARLTGGEVIPCDVALVGIGVLPNEEVAAGAGLPCDNGVVVDRAARSAHPDIYAIGDVAQRPLVHYHRNGRLESVHNAIEGGKIAAASILGATPPVEEAPWFWSDQYDLKLQTVGLWTGADTRVVRGDPASGRFAVFYLRDGRILAVDAVNSAPEFLVGKKLVAASAAIAPAELADTSISMKDIGARGLS